MYFILFVGLRDLLKLNHQICRYTRASLKNVFWACRLASKYKVTDNVRNAQTININGGSTSKFGPLQPPKGR